MSTPKIPRKPTKADLVDFFNDPHIEQMQVEDTDPQRSPALVDPAHVSDMARERLLQSDDFGEVPENVSLLKEAAEARYRRIKEMLKKTLPNK